MFAGFFDLDWLPDFMTNIWFMIAMGVVLLGLIGLMIFMRNQRPEE